LSVIVNFYTVYTFSALNKERVAVMAGLRKQIVRYLIALYTIFGGIAFFAIQTGKLFRPEVAEAEMAK